MRNKSFTRNVRSDFQVWPHAARHRLHPVETFGHRCSWIAFCDLADAIYKAGFGREEVGTDLTVVFSDGQNMWCVAHDGSEEWAYSRPLRRPETTRLIKLLLTSPEGVGHTLAPIKGPKE